MGEIMRFDVVRRESDDAVVPEALSVIEPLSVNAALHTREFVFGAKPKFGRLSVAWTINGKQFEPDRPSRFSNGMERFHCRMNWDGRIRSPSTEAKMCGSSRDSRVTEAVIYYIATI
jgi:hypothetical protein